MICSGSAGVSRHDATSTTRPIRTPTRPLDARMTLAILRYLLFVPISLLAAWASMLLAQIAALPVFVRRTPPKGTYSERADGEWLCQGWAWVTTHDAPVDSYAHGTAGHTHWLLKRFNRVSPESNPGWLRYANRVLWVWRNPAYYVKHHALGFDTAGAQDTYVRGRFDTIRNGRGRIGFLYEREYRYLRIQFGWKLYRDDPDGKRMFAFRLKPKFR